MVAGRARRTAAGRSEGASVDWIVARRTDVAATRPSPARGGWRAGHTRALLDIEPRTSLAAAHAVGKRDTFARAITLANEKGGLIERGGEVEEEVRAFVDMLAMFPWQSAYGISVELVLVVRDALGAEGRSGGAGHWVEQNEGWEAAARMVLVSKQDLPSAVLGASARRWLMGTNVGLRYV